MAFPCVPSDENGHENLCLCLGPNVGMLMWLGLNGTMVQRVPTPLPHSARNLGTILALDAPCGEFPHSSRDSVDLSHIPKQC